MAKKKKKTRKKEPSMIEKKQIIKESLAAIKKESDKMIEFFHLQNEPLPGQIFVLIYSMLKLESDENLYFKGMENFIIAAGEAIKERQKRANKTIKKAKKS